MDKGLVEAFGKDAMSKLGDDAPKIAPPGVPAHPKPPGDPKGCARPARR